MARVRTSNFEALRIVAMLLVLILHSTLRANGVVTYDDILEVPIASLIYMLVGTMSLVCVDTFILISGYFGIKPNLRSLCNLLFIVYFYRYLIYILTAVCTGDALSFKFMVVMLNPLYCDWFICAYLGLYLFAYIINVFVEHTDKTAFKLILIIYLTVMITLGWIIPNEYTSVLNFDLGCSVYSFIGLYLLGRFLKLHFNAQTVTRKRALWAYLSVSALSAIFYVLSIPMATTEQLSQLHNDWLVSYDSAFTIAASAALLLLFSKFSFNSRVVNWLAASALSVYLIHTNDCVFPLFVGNARWLSNKLGIFWSLPAFVLYAVAVYVICVLIDQVRILSWRCAEHIYKTMISRNYSN